MCAEQNKVNQKKNLQAVENEFFGKSSIYDIPVLLVVFNRPQKTKLVFEQIRKLRPAKLFVACDGSRSNFAGEEDVVKNVQEICTNVDWECEVKTRFSKVNQGCGSAVNNAISWVFGTEVRAIILEDDCLPNASFFRFCAELLEKYQDDKRIGMISGVNHLNYVGEHSYWFSRYKGCWGWATWRDRWVEQDITMSWRESSQASDILKNISSDKDCLDIWKKRIKFIDDSVVSAWDWQWYFSLAANNQMGIFPRVNLVSNIGFGEDATHTKGNASDEILNNYEMTFPLIHPRYITPNSNLDKQYERKKILVHSYLFRKLMSSPFGPFLRTIKKWLVGLIKHERVSD